MKRKVWSILLTLCMVVAMMPAAAFAGENGSTAEVTTASELTTALQSDSVTEIHVTGDLTYSGSLDASKKITINEGVTLMIDCSYNATVTGTIDNNGTIKLTGKGECIWTATTTGSGKLSAENQNWEEYQTYVDYGCVPENMLKNCKINIVDDISKKPTVSLPESMTVGDKITPTVTNLIKGVDISKVFKYTWKNGNGSERYNGAANPTLTDAGTLSLNLSVNRPYVMRTSSGTTGSLDKASGTVHEKLYDTIYVDATNGDDSKIGDTEATAVKTISKAMDKVAENGTIIVLSDCSLNSVSFAKNVTVKSKEGQKYALTTQSAYPAYVKNGVTATFNSVDLSNTLFTRSDQSSAGTGNLVFNSCTGTNMSIGSDDISNITLNNSQLGGTLTASGTLTMKTSTFDGQFFTNDFIAEGDCAIIVAKKNAPCEVEGTITTENPVTITPKELKSGEKLIEVPNSSADSIAANFQLEEKNTQNGHYALKCRKVDTRTYIGVSEQVSSETGKISIGNEPVIGQEVVEPANNQSGFNSIYCTIKSATWSGYDETTHTWKLGDTPKLTVVLKTGTSNDQFFHFDNAFDVNQLKVYSWKDLKEMADFTDAALNSDVTCKVEEGQGVKDDDDGRTFTFTIQYPEVTCLDQTIEMDKSDRTATCGEELDAREATAKTALSYESSDPEIASVDPVTGKITAHKAGEVTITVKAAQSDLYNEATASYKLTVSHDFGDTWKHDETSHWKECACGEISEKASHSGGKATTTEKAKCSICGTEYGELLPAANDQKPGSTTNNNGAKTGDGMPIGLLAVLMLAAGAGITFCGRKLYKSR